VFYNIPVKIKINVYCRDSISYIEVLLWLCCHMFTNSQCDFVCYRCEHFLLGQKYELSMPVNFYMFAGVWSR